MKQAIGVPQEILWEEADYTPQQIKRMKRFRDEEHQRQQDLLAAQNGGGEVTPALTVGQEGQNLAIGGLPGPTPDPAEPEPKPKPK